MIEISLGQRLHELRDRADLSLRELAKKVGISGPFLSDIAVAIETSQGTVVDQLLQTPHCTIYPLNPKAARSYRDRKAPSGTKSDHLDAWSFADALRVDFSNWKPLLAQGPLLESPHP